MTIEQVFQQNNLYLWAKDINYRYIYCNENYARAAGLDSPHQIIGMSDEQMPWRALTNHFRKGDHEVFRGNIRVNVPEVEIMANKMQIYWYQKANCLMQIKSVLAYQVRL